MQHLFAPVTRVPHEMQCKNTPATQVHLVGPSHNPKDPMHNDRASQSINHSTNAWQQQQQRWKDAPDFTNNEVVATACQRWKRNLDDNGTSRSDDPSTVKLLQPSKKIDPVQTTMILSQRKRSCRIRCTYRTWCGSTYRTWCGRDPPKP